MKTCIFPLDYFFYSLIPLSIKILTKTDNFINTMAAVSHFHHFFHFQMSVGFVVNFVDLH